MRKQKIRINGKDVNVPRGTTTEELERMIGLDEDHLLIEQNGEGKPSRILDKKAELPKKSISNLTSIPRYVQGFNSRDHRIQNEISIISSRFPVLFDESNLNYVKIMNFPLNRNYNYSSTSLLIKLPSQYTHVPPEHFYIKKGLLYRGKSPTHYFENAGFNDLDSLGWSKYCLHLKSWNPTDDIISGDSLISFLEIIKVVFDHIELERV